jgi:ABC-type bacteriocin/lantibiotic exporter with double-glycine peptidase domain
LTVFEGGFSIAAILLIFAAVRSSLETHQLETGQFLAFFAAFGLSLAAVSELANALGNIVVAIPRFDRLRPVLAEPVETAANRNPPGELHGAIELKELTFRYTAGGPAILDKLSLHIEPREHVAIVGPSGSGKSTLFRLLLGFEKPDEGAIFFDGKAIETLDIGALRRQIGVVLQNGKLVSGSLYENICAGAALPLERAMEAARLAGLESDIAAMPMGIHTMIGEGMSTLSGGQQQRLMIARALVHRPRIILFDEATSALDNRTQAIVSASLEKLNVTRIVIAQRLSTVQRADRILVLKGGAVVQSGRFDELLNTPGMFADFAKRQML